MVHELFEVNRGAFEIRIPATGELAAARQIEIKNMLESRAVIARWCPRFIERASFDAEERWCGPVPAWTSYPRPWFRVIYSNP